MKLSQAPQSLALTQKASTTKDTLELLTLTFPYNGSRGSESPSGRSFSGPLLFVLMPLVFSKVTPATLNGCFFFDTQQDVRQKHLAFQGPRLLLGISACRGFVSWLLPLLPFQAQNYPLRIP